MTRLQELKALIAEMELPNFCLQQQLKAEREISKLPHTELVEVEDFLAHLNADTHEFLVTMASAIEEQIGYGYVRGLDLSFQDIDEIVAASKDLGASMINSVVEIAAKSEERKRQSEIENKRSDEEIDQIFRELEILRLEFKSK